MAKELRLNKVTLMVLVALGIVVTLFIISNLGRPKKYSEETVRLSELISASIDLAERGGKRVVDVRNMGDSEIGRLSKGKIKLGKEEKDEFVTLGDKVSLDFHCGLILKATHPYSAHVTRLKTITEQFSPCSCVCQS